MNEHPSVYKSPEGYAEVAEAYDAVLEFWPVPYETLMIPTHLGRTHVIACGAKDAPPLVLLHGGGNCALMWIYAVAGFSPHFRIYAPDIIGDIGKSAPSRRIAQVSEYIEWLKDMFDGLGVERTHIAGVSWGGGHSLFAALSASERLDRVVSMCPAWGLAKLRTALMFRLLVSGLFPSRRRIRKLLQGFSATESAFSDSVSERLIDYLVIAHKHYRIPRPVKYPIFADEELQSIKTPTLVLIGDREVIYSDTEAAAERARRLIPNVRVDIIPNASHALFYDQPEVVNHRIVEFLKQ